MKGLRGFKFLIAKSYLDKGMSVTSYLKYLIALFGVTSKDLKTTLIVGFTYLILCYIVGRMWYKYKFIETELEISNIFNPFVKEMRRKI